MQEAQSRSDFLRQWGGKTYVHQISFKKNNLDGDFFRRILKAGNLLNFELVDRRKNENHLDLFTFSARKDSNLMYRIRGCSTRSHLKYNTVISHLARRIHICCFREGDDGTSRLVFTDSSFATHGLSRFHF